MCVVGGCVRARARAGGGANIFLLKQKGPWQKRFGNHWSMLQVKADSRREADIHKLLRKQVEGDNMY